MMKSVLNLALMTYRAYKRLIDLQKGFTSVLGLPLYWKTQ